MDSGPFKVGSVCSYKCDGWDTENVCAVWGGCCWARANPLHQSCWASRDRGLPSLCPGTKWIPRSIHPCVLGGLWGGTPAGREHPVAGNWWLHRELPSPQKSQSWWSTALQAQHRHGLSAPAHSPRSALALAPGWHSPAADKQPGSAAVLPTFPTRVVQKTLSLWMAVKIRPKESSALMSSATVSLCGFFRAEAKSVQCSLIA